MTYIPLNERTFLAPIDNFIRKCNFRMRATVRKACLDMVNDMQRVIPEGGEPAGRNRMPVDTGFLRNSLVATVTGGTLEGSRTYAFSGTNAEGGRPDSYRLAIGTLEVGDVFTAGYTANYARFQEYGTRYMSGKFFVTSAVKRWQGYVASAALHARTTIK